MIQPDKLFQIHPGQKRRKLALCFGALERDLTGTAEAGCRYSFDGMTRGEYVKRLVSIVLEDPGLTDAARADIAEKLNAAPFDELRVCNCARHHLLSLIGTFPAEWDMIMAPHAERGSASRRFFPGVAVYAEDIRSPFNLGSVFRTAEAMGAEKVYVSPFCADPAHPRARRSAMGCIDLVPWERVPLGALPEDEPVFVLETGGTPIETFRFPPRGVVIIGSEELGASPEALRRASRGCVSIPMTGAKASLNVGVAFGILMQAWTSRLKTPERPACPEN